MKGPVRHRGIGDSHEATRTAFNSAEYSVNSEAWQQAMIAGNPLCAAETKVVPEILVDPIEMLCSNSFAAPVLCMQHMIVTGACSINHSRFVFRVEERQ